MTEQEMWEDAVCIVREEYAALSAEQKAAVGSVAALIRLDKEAISSLTENKGASAVCEKCGGACCATGKYHFTVVDLLVFLSGGIELFSPSFQEDLCPYMGNGMCLMSPPLRPLTCITFHCEPLESLLSPAQLERIYSLERRLRNYYAQLESFFGTRLTQGLLLNYEGYLQGLSIGILTKK